MNVVLLNDQLNAGGAEKVLVNMANLLKQKGVDVSVVLFLSHSSLDTLIDPSIPVSYLNRKGRFDLKAMFKLKRILSNADIVHVHSRYNLRYFMVAKYVTGIFKPKLVFHEHVPILKLDAFTRLLFKNIDAYVAVIRSMYSWANQTVGLRQDKVFYLPNIVTAPSAVANNRMGKRIVMVGNFWKFKNQAFAIELINQLPADFTLDIYGMVNDEEYYKELKRFIAYHKLSERINLKLGINNVYDVLPAYNFAIHTSPHETGPLVLLEYMQVGLPFLTYNTGDVATNMKGVLDELILDSFEVPDWIERINEVMMDEEKRTAIVTRMKELLAEKYSEERYVSNLQSIYKQVMEKRNVA